MDDHQIHSAAVRVGQHLRFGSVSLLLSNDPNGDCGLGSEIETCDPKQLHPLRPGHTLIPATLKPAPRRVLDLFLKGLTERQVAEQLHISPHTVHNHAREIYRAYRVHSRLELLLQAIPKPNEGQATVFSEGPLSSE